MDHDSAIRTRATERYLLGELSDEERERFEEHFFSCAVCADDVRVGYEFAAGARAVFREEAAALRMPAPAPVPAAPWWKGAWALPASAGLNVTLLGAVAALGLIVVSPMPVGETQVAHFVQEVPVFGPQRGDEAVREIARQTPQIVVAAFLPEGAVNLRYRIVAVGGTVVRSGETGPPPREASGQILLSIPVANLAAGEYQIVLTGSDTSGPPLGSRKIRIAAK